MEITTLSTEDTKKLAEQLANITKAGDVYALYGDLGSGKTTFTSYLTKALGIESRVQSPTFVIIRSYTQGPSDIKNLYHVDLYRLTSLDEILDLGLEEIMLEKEAVTVIEWPELAESILPEKTKRIYFNYVDEDSRKIKYDL